MNQPGFNYSIHSVPRHRLNFLPTTHRPRSFPRYVRPSLDHQARSYRIPVRQQRGVNYMPRNRQFRSYSRNPRPRQWSPYHRPNPVNSPNTKTRNTVLTMLGRIYKLFDFTMQLVGFIQGKIQAKVGASGFSPGCICGGVAATTTVVIVSVSLGVGIGVGIGGAVGIPGWLGTAVANNNNTLVIAYNTSNTTTTYNSSIIAIAYNISSTPNIVG